MRTERRLTSFSHGAGCGCKLGPEDLKTLLRSVSLPAVTEDVLVSSDTGDDAAVYRLPDGRALIATLDFFTPIVDDPYDWGRIAATNALSDVYAMGGKPFLALNIVSWPVDDLPLDMLGRVLQGGADAAAKAGVVVLGGHSITDPEPKYGMVALGFVEADKILRNSTAPADARLFLTKPLGLGIVSTAVKRGVASEDLLLAAVEQMTTLNADASEATVEAGAGSATDVTGFGLLGHLYRMLLASEVAAEIDASAVPVLAGVADLARAGVIPGGTGRNFEYVRSATDWGALTEWEQLVLADAQTSGGMLVATADGERLARAFAAHGVPFAEIGKTVSGEPGRMSIHGRLGE